jgi:hypothetical protein
VARTRTWIGTQTSGGGSPSRVNPKPAYAPVQRERPEPAPRRTTVVYAPLEDEGGTPADLTDAGTATITLTATGASAVADAGTAPAAITAADDDALADAGTVAFAITATGSGSLVVADQIIAGGGWFGLKRLPPRDARDAGTFTLHISTTGDGELHGMAVDDLALLALL